MLGKFYNLVLLSLAENVCLSACCCSDVLVGRPIHVAQCSQTLSAYMWYPCPPGSPDNCQVDYNATWYPLDCTDPIINPNVCLNLILKSSWEGGQTNGMTGAGQCRACSHSDPGSYDHQICGGSHSNLKVYILGPDIA
jgi:hypothetical protein